LIFDNHVEVGGADSQVDFTAVGMRRENRGGFVSMAKSTADAEWLRRLELYDKLVATRPGVERKGATVPYTSLNGHMFSYLSKEGKLELRLPPDVREAFLKKYNARLCEAYGVVQKEYVEVPDALLGKTQELKKFFESSHNYVAGLKPKPTAKTKTK
jgi:hypothetical protein